MTAVVETPRVDPDLLADIKRFGAADVSACFSCGNCSAICPLSNNDGTFPRRMIRYGQVGLRDELLSSKELWACYHCGLCSESCPQRADPGEYMAAARRYAIASYDRTGIARTLYTHPILGSGLLVVLAAAFATFFSVKSGAQPRGSLQFFSFLPDAVVHWTGIAVMIAVVLVALTGVATMVHGLARREGVHGRDLVVGAASWRRAWRGAWSAVAVESLGQKRFRDDCADADPSEHWYERRWIIHATVMWGFIGLLVATMADYGLSLTGVRATGTPEPVWYPVRLLGTLAGLAMVAGVSTMILARLRHTNQASAYSHQSDWVFLTMLWVVGVSGLLTELALYLPGAPSWGYWMFVAHVSLAMELLLLLPFMKFAHVIYRPVALFFQSLAGARH